MESVARNYRAFALIARPFPHTGPGQAATFAVPSFARQLARIERGLAPPVISVGNLSSSRDLLDVRDVVRAYAGLLESGRAGGTYNVATGHPLLMSEVLDRLRAQCRVATTVEQDPSRFRAAEISRCSGDSFLLRSEVHWSAQIPLDITLRDTLQYWRGQQSI
jgi:GDP-4-dehydro-6-deoxy-D-mannose reductase